MLRVRRVSLLLGSLSALACSESSTSPGTPDLTVFGVDPASARGVFVTDLGVLPGYDSSAANAINDTGLVAGVSKWPGPAHATLWQLGGAITDLGVLPLGTYSVAQAINYGGVVVGYADTGAYSSRGFKWTPGVGMISLPVLNGGASSAAFGINNLGVVVGRSDSSDGGTYAARWDGLAVQNLGWIPGSLYNVALGINSAGVAVGVSNYQAVRWSSPGVLSVLAVPAGFTFSVATAVNDAGEIVGYGWDGLTYRALFWRSGGAVVVLPPLSSGSNAMANALNRSGNVVGWARDASFNVHAVFWRGPTAPIEDLGVLAPYALSMAAGINRRDEIVGVSVGGPGIQARATCWAFRRHAC